MPAKAKKEIHIGQFIVQGTSNIFTANKAIRKLLSSQRCGLKEARYSVDGKTIIIKPRQKTLQTNIKNGD